jgi:hypothetical protein
LDFTCASVYSTRNLAFSYEILAQDDIEMEDKSMAPQPVVEDVEEERSLNVEDKDVMQQMGKRQQLAV